MANNIHKYFLTILISLILLTPTESTLNGLSVTPTDLPINGLSTYTWTITYNNLLSRQSFTLNFPTCVSVLSNVSITTTSATSLNITNIGSSSLTFTLTPNISSLTYSFTISNIKNCYHSAGYKNLTVYNTADNMVEQYTTMNTVYYRQGIISNCVLNYDNNTGNTSSKLSINYKIQNPIIGPLFVIKLNYPTYYSSTWSLTSFNSPNCQISANNAIIGGLTVSATLNAGDQSLTCSFTLPSGTITPSDNLTLILTNITNPVTSQLYATNTDFILTSFDNNSFMYDRSAFCTITTVPIMQYDGQFTQTALINTQMSPIQLNTVNTVPIRIARNDQLIVTYTNGIFSNCAPRILVDKSGGISAVTFIQQATSLSQTLIYNSNGSSILNNTMSIEFSDCLLKMPTSTLPLVFSLVFGAATGTVGIYDNYMQINANIMPTYYTMNALQVRTVLSDPAIGQLSSYTFSITLAQSLSQTPSIIIQFPTQISISLASSTISSCNIAINGNGIGSKNCQYLSPNSVYINITNPIPLPIGTIIQITLPNLRNPSNPSIIFTNFNIITYFTSSQIKGITQYGNNIITALPYKSRTIYPQIPSNNFKVYTSNTQFSIVYEVGVNLTSGSIVTFTFNTTILLNINNILPTTPSGITLNHTSTNQYVYNLPSITSGTRLILNFTCLTPSKTGIYGIVDIQTTYNSITYQKTINPITIQITQPYTNPFTISPTNTTTGVITNYTITFTTIVPMPNNFILQLIFPISTTMLIGQSRCISSSCFTTNITDISSGSINRFQLYLQNTTNCITGCSYTIQITNIKNQRYIGNTANFIFKVITNDTLQNILYGQNITNIIITNILYAAFDQIDDYYLSNTNPIHFNIGVTNRLEYGDYVMVMFGSNTYTINSNGGGSNNISCAIATCTANISNGFTNFYIILSTTQVLQTNITLQLYGLISSSTTVYGSSAIPISISTYTSNSKMIDSGYLYYLLDCAQNNTIISKHCKTCGNVLGNYVCTSCYSNRSLYNGTSCQTSCSITTNFLYYNNSVICVLCQAPCYTCTDQTNCLSCIPGFYFLVGSTTCLSSCNTSGGYFITPNTQNSSLLQCKSCSTLNCISCPNNICDACSSGVLMNGICSTGCGVGTYNSGGSCRNCDPSCYSCDGPYNTNCFRCSTNYYPQNGACTSNCPYGSVPNGNGVCGCSGDCATCITSSTTCLTCTNPSYFMYNYVCYSVCPQNTYPSGQQCSPCTSGCQTCTSTTCYQCSNNYNIFQNKCYLDCKTIGQTYVSMLVNGILRCDRCPDGCTQCNIKYQCSSCLPNYILNGTICKRQCQLTNTCNITATVQPTLPLPGLITFGIFTICIILLKIFILKDIYLPYTLLFGAALIQFILLVACLGTLDVRIKSNAVARLLQVTLASNTFYTAQGVLAAAVLLNYLMNIFSIWIFCKYIKPMILPRQIDIITNYIAFIFSVLTNYRFYLLSFSRLVKKPYIQVKNAQKLKNLHIILSVSYIIDIIALVGAFMLVINTTKLSVIFMLSLDLILIILFTWIIFIWVLIKPKNDQYYSQTKKYSLQQNHITQQGSIHNNDNINVNKYNINDKQNSKVKLQNNTNQKLHVQQYAEQQVDDLPTQQQNFIKIVSKQQPQNIQQNNNNNSNNNSNNNNNNGSNPKTKRKQQQQRNQQINNVSSQKKFFNNTNQSNNKQQKIQDNKLSQRYKKQSTLPQKNSDRIKSTRYNNNNNNQPKQSKITKHQRNQSQSIITGINKINKNNNNNNNKKQDIYQFEDNDHTYTNNNRDKDDSDINQQKLINRPIKYKPSNARSTTLKIQHSASVMKKNKNNNNISNNFQSQIADSNIDQLDLQSIIQTRVIDRSKNNKNNNNNNNGSNSNRIQHQRDTRTQADKSQQNNQQYIEQISPSWFNIQNQRYDIDDKQLE